MRSSEHPLLILCVDAGEASFFTRFVEQGHLPHLASLMRRGVWGEIKGPEMLSEAGCRRSLFTGARVVDHGLFYFRQLVPQTYDLILTELQDGRALPFWAHLPRGQRALVVDVLENEFVPTPGIQVRNLTHENPFFPRSCRPEALRGRLKQLDQRYGTPPQVDPYARHREDKPDRRDYATLRERVRIKGAMCRELMAEGSFDVFVLNFVEPHVGAHRLWDYRPEHLRRIDNPFLAEGVRTLYDDVDRELGLCIEALPRGANVALVSPTGMKDQYPIDGLTEALMRDLGYQVAPRGGGMPTRALDIVRALVPDFVRRELSKHLSFKQQEKLIADGMRSKNDWSRTRAFALPSLYTSYIRVNLKGREPEGIVERGEDYHQLVEQLAQDFEQLRHPQTGEPVIEEAIRTAAHYGCEPPDWAPDLMVVWKASTDFLESVVHPRARLRQDAPGYYRNTYHSYHGFLAAAGPSIAARGRVEAFDVLDMAPLFLELAGAPKPPELRGAVPSGVLAAAFREAEREAVAG